MGNGIEEGKSHSEKQDPIIPNNGLLEIDGVQYRVVDGELFRARTGEQMVREMSKAEDDDMDEKILWNEDS